MWKTLLNNSILKTYALSFYTSQTSLGGSKYFVPDQKLNCIYCHNKKIVSALEQNLINANHLSVWHKTFETGTCLVLLQVPKCFGLVQIFCARPKIYLRIVAVTNILCQTKRWFAFSKIGFCAGTKVFEEALNAVKFLGWLKKFWPAQNILGPVKGQGISTSTYSVLDSLLRRF